MSDLEKCTAAWEAVSASSQREPLPLYCAEHDKWELQHNEVARVWRDACCDLLATPPTTRQGAIALNICLETVDVHLRGAQKAQDRRHRNRPLGDQ
jgi:hypothetical protein